MAPVSKEELQQRTERVAALTLRGCTAAQIAAELGISRRSVDRHRERGGVKGERPRLSDEQSVQVVALTRCGYSADQIGSMLGVSGRTVVRYRKARGIAQPTPKRLSEEERRTALAWFEDGASAAEVGRTIGRSASTVRKAFPGRAWTRQQVYEYISATRRFRGLLERSA